MADEKDDLQDETAEEPAKKGGSKKLLIIIVAAGIVLGAGGFAGYKLLAGKKGGEDVQQEKVDANTSIFALAPFVLNLSDHGRYLKVTIQFEVSDESFLDMVEAKNPQLRDTIITLVSSKSLTSIASPEGKFQLKDELLFRANQVMGVNKDVFKNLYFTEFVMQ
ncbi:MAG TPA: flagellar basal body protein FliL [Nitrospirae bacterium]|nr:flagellar basal body protein FliL [Nitrospirota bacterium]